MFSVRKCYDTVDNEIMNEFLGGIMKKQVKHILTMATVVTSMIALGGCSGNTKEEATSLESMLTVESNKETQSTADDSLTEQEGEVSYGGSIVVGIQNDLDSLDPHLAGSAGTSEVLFNIFEGLVKPNSDGELIPAVASDYNISEDGMRYTFTLRDNVYFHNGELVTIEDVIYSVKRCAGILEGQSESLVSAYSVIEEVNAVDEKTIELVLSQSDTELIGYLTEAILPKDYENQSTQPIGCGPFRFVSYSLQQSFVMECFDEYWGEKPYLDRVEFRIVASTDAAMMELKAGSIDVYPYLTSDQANELSNQFDIKIGNSNLVQALFLNNAKEPFDDIRVRQALCYTVDVQDIMDMVADGYGTEIGSNMFPAFGKYYEDLSGFYDPDLVKAKDLLAEAGYPDGFEMTITVPSNYQFHIDTAQVIVEQLKQIGISAKIELVEWASWYSDVYKGREYQSTIVGLDADLAPKALLQRYGSTTRSNFINFSNEEYDNVLAETLAAVDENIKIKNYHRLQEILAEQAASVYLQDSAVLVAVNPKLGGYTFYPVYVQDMSKIYYKK